MIQGISDIRIVSQIPIISPNKMKKQILPSEETVGHIIRSREIASSIIRGFDNRLLTIVGPCSIHNPKEGLEYAQKLLRLQEKYPHLFIVMRTYFEKPRTTVGWKGLINDPHLNGSFDLEGGIQIARKFLLEINNLGLPTATEFIDPIITQYIVDLITWGAIGARTTESQTHREMVSGLSCPLGFKNGTDGCEQIAIDALGASIGGHSFLGINGDGVASIIRTLGNNDGHIILRGGKKGTNYDEDSVRMAVEKLLKAGVNPGLMIDLSHANSSKDHNKQIIVANDVARQIDAGNNSITGVMIESNTGAGKQSFDPLKDDKSKLNPGVSITDACISIEQTEDVLGILNDSVGKRNNA